MTKIGQTLQVGSIINQHLITLRPFVPFTLAHLIGGGGAHLNYIYKMKIKERTHIFALFSRFQDINILPSRARLGR